MASATDIADIEAAIAARWTRCPVRGWTADREVAADLAEFLALSFPLAGEERQSSLNAGAATLYSLDGASFRLVLMVPRYALSADANALKTAAGDLDTLRRSLRGRIGTTQRIEVRRSSGPNDPVDDGTYWQIACTFLYRRLAAA